MRRHRTAIALAALAQRSLAGASTYSFLGEGTSYSLGDPSGGNCNLMSYPSDATTKYAALNAAQWDSTMNCGRCAQVTCTDAQCANAPQASEVVYIVDQCPGCADGDLDLSPEVFEGITGLSYTRVSIEWSFVDCPVEGGIEYCLKKGSNSFWTAVQPTNLVSGVKSLTINGKATTMVDSAYYFLLDGNSQDATDLSQVTIAMVGVNGEEVQDTVSFASESCVQGSSQFSTGTPTSEDADTLYASAASTSVVTTDSPTTTPASTTAAPTPTPSPTPEVTPEVTSTPSPTPTATVSPTPSFNGSSSDEATSASVESIAAPASDVQTEAPAESFATSAPSPTPTPTTNVLRSSTSNALQTTPTVIGLGALVLIAVILLLVLAINARRKKLALRNKQSEAEAEDRLPTMMSPRSPSASSSSYYPAQTPTRSFAILY